MDCNLKINLWLNLESASRLAEASTLRTVGKSVECDGCRRRTAPTAICVAFWCVARAEGAPHRRHAAPETIRDAVRDTDVFSPHRPLRPWLQAILAHPSSSSSSFCLSVRFRVLTNLLNAAVLAPSQRAQCIC